jgi:hypothetical protein
MDASERARARIAAILARSGDGDRSVLDQGLLLGRPLLALEGAARDAAGTMTVTDRPGPIRLMVTGSYGRPRLTRPSSKRAYSSSMLCGTSAPLEIRTVSEARWPVGPSKSYEGSQVMPHRGVTRRPLLRSFSQLRLTVSPFPVWFRCRRVGRSA